MVAEDVTLFVGKALLHHLCLGQLPILQQAQQTGCCLDFQTVSERCRLTHRNVQQVEHGLFSMASVGLGVEVGTL